MTAPAKPTGLTATPKANSVDLIWDSPANPTITGWQYQFKTDGAYGAWNTMTSYLAARESYTTPSAVGAHQKTVSWINSNDANIDKYQYRTKPGNQPFGAWRDMPNSDSDTMSYTFTALAGNTRYVLEVRGLYSSTAASLTKFRVGGRANGTAHTFKIRAINSSGNGEASDPSSAATPKPAPSAPTLTAATPGDAQVALAWTYGGTPAATSWQYSQDGGKTWTAVPSSDSNTRAYPKTGLTNNTQYTFLVRGKNTYGEGAPSLPVKAAPIAKPAKPTGFSATAKDASAILSWTDPSDSSITKWQYTTDGGTTWTDIPNSGASTTSYTKTALTNGTAYTFKIRAVNASGDGAESDAKTATPEAAPAKPTGFSATAKAASVDLAWTDPGDSSITKWEYRKKTNAGYGAWTQMSADATATSYAVTPLTNDTAYTFQIRAANPYGNGPVSDAKTATPIAIPAKPSGFRATPFSTYVVLSWNNPNDDSITKWQYTTDDGTTWTDIPNSGASTTSFTTATTLTNGTEYKFKIRAVNPSGNGAESEEQTTTPIAVPLAPAGLTATPSTSGDAEVELEWTDPNNSSITKWQLLQATGNSIFVVGTGSAQEITLSWTDPNKSNILSWWYSRKAHDGGWSTWTRMAGADANSTSHTLALTLTDGKRYTFQARARVSGEVHYNATGLLVHAKITPTGPTNNKLSYDATGLEHNVAYQFLLRAVNPSGNGAPVLMNPVRPVAGKPGAPALAASISGSQASLSWTKNADGRWADKWQYRKKTTADWPSTPPYGWTDVANSNDATRAHAVTGLDNGKTYDFQVRAVNNAGNGTASTSASASTKPAKPGRLRGNRQDEQLHQRPIHAGTG